MSGGSDKPLSMDSENKKFKGNSYSATANPAPKPSNSKTSIVDDNDTWGAISAPPLHPQLDPSPCQRGFQVYTTIFEFYSVKIYYIWCLRPTIFERALGRESERKVLVCKESFQDEYEDLTNPNISIYRNCICLRCFVQNFLAVTTVTTLRQRRLQMLQTSVQMRLLQSTSPSSPPRSSRLRRSANRAATKIKIHRDSQRD
ncbi:unnamed protein product [Fraxinus pennsylvanica]|uniref:Uncharacterized protein n=1 Tax=Fraxinus pennsylvanica TaxID=56036 RepID=A0AAD1ZEB5_9LAMI|nr:unnamed protein product [Fraxinus pennsylvanica]